MLFNGRSLNFTFLGPKLELPSMSAYSPYLRYLWYRLTSFGRTALREGEVTGSFTPTMSRSQVVSAMSDAEICTQAFVRTVVRKPGLKDTNFQVRNCRIVVSSSRLNSRQSQSVVP